MRQRKHHIFRCKNCNAYYYTGWNNCGTCGTPLLSHVDIDSWPQIYIAPISTQTKSVIGLKSDASDTIVIPTITTDGEVVLLMGGHKASLETIRKHIKQTIGRYGQAGNSYAGIYFSFVFPDKDGDMSLVTFCETLIFTANIEQFDQWYNVFNKIKSTNDEYWNLITSVLRDDHAKSWINSMLVNIKTNNNWPEYVQEKLDRGRVNVQYIGVGETIVAGSVAIV